MTTRKVLCPVDFSAASREALIRAREFAGSMSAELTVLHAYWVPHYIQPNLLVWMATGPRPIWEIAEEQANTELDAFLSSIDPKLGEQVTKRIVHDDPANAIIELARQEQISMIVMGTHGRTGAARLMLGSVAERVVRLAPCPVLTLHAPDSSSRPHAERAAPDAAASTSR
jgi:nucleotide-binding universal stress UspA family protein